MTFLIKKTESIKYAVQKALTQYDPEIISTRKRKSKRAKYYLNIGAGYDTETTTIKHTETIDGIEYERADFAFIYHYQFKINGVYICGRNAEDIGVIFSELIAQMQELHRGARLIIWVANLSYEFSFVKKQLAEIGISAIFAKTPRNPLFIELGGVIELRECLGLFGSSLARVARDYTTTQKAVGDLDYTKIRTPETSITRREKYYNKCDVDILEELGLKAHEIYTCNYREIPYTKTGVLRQECKKAIKNIKWEYNANYKLMPNTEKEYCDFRRFLYRGGLSHSNVIYCGKHLHNIRNADLTSDYSAQINHHFFPAGELVEIKNDEFMRYSNKCYIAYVTLFNIEPKTSHTLISRSKILNLSETMSCYYDNGRLIRGDNVQLIVNEIDIKTIALYYDCEIVVDKAYMFTERRKAPKWLLSLMNDYYLKKQTLKAGHKENTLDYKESKERVNSFYGMCATRLYDSECYIDGVEIKEREQTNADGAPLTYDDRRARVWLNPYIAYWTTSYARAILAYFITKYPELIVQYDTDGIYYITDCTNDIKGITKERIDALETELSQYNDKMSLKNERLFRNRYFETLGTWDISKPFTDFKCLGAKRYIYRKQDGSINPVIAGCNKSAYIAYCDKIGADPIEFFTDGMTLRHIDSKKIASLYNDKPMGLKRVIDYKGDTAIVDIGTFCALYEIPFKMTVKAEFNEHIQRMREYVTKLPKDYIAHDELFKELERF